jgi:hypothetical protein
MKTWLGVVSVGVMAAIAGSAVADNDSDHDNRKRVFRAQLVGLNEVPPVSTGAGGQFYAVLNQKGDELRYWISFSDLSADVSQSHIHFGNHHTNGGIVVWLCEGTLSAPTDRTPPCGGPRSSKVSGVITRDEVVNTAAAQGITAGEFDELIAAMRAGAAYANVHSGAPGDPNAMPPRPTVGFPPGEIRGQID